MYLVNRTMARPLVSRICSLKSLSVIFWSSLACGSPIGSSVRTWTVTFDKSCPVTDEATGADAFGRNLGMPNSLNESFTARNDTKTRRSAIWGIVDNNLNNCGLCWSWLLLMLSSEMALSSTVSSIAWGRPQAPSSQIPVVGTTWVMSLNPRSTSFNSVKWVVSSCRRGVLHCSGFWKNILHTARTGTLHGVDVDVSHGNSSQHWSVFFGLPRGKICCIQMVRGKSRITDTVDAGPP